MQITVITAAVILHMGKLRLRAGGRLFWGRRADGWQGQIPKPCVSVQSPMSKSSRLRASRVHLAGASHPGTAHGNTAITKGQVRSARYIFLV